MFHLHAAFALGRGRRPLKWILPAAKLITYGESGCSDVGRTHAVALSILGMPFGGLEKNELDLAYLEREAHPATHSASMREARRRPELYRRASGRRR